MNKSQQPDLSNVPSNVPEGATHWTARVSGRSLAAFWRPNGSYYDCFALTEASDPFWQKGSFELPSDAIEIVLPWKVDGLPPVELICRFIGTNECRSNVEELRQGAEVTIIAHYEQTNGAPLAAFTFIDEEGEKRIGGAIASCFAPLKTPEQIASEERIEAAQVWLKGVEEQYGKEAADKCEDILMQFEARMKVAP